MTCREFMDAAEALMLSQLLLAPTEDEPMSIHGRECAACGKWLESQRRLGMELHSLRTHTAQREASPRVEEAVLQAFRTRGFAPAAALAPERAAPAAWRLSRFFEIGAYAAVAAALIVGVFLGSRLLRDKRVETGPSQAQTVSGPQTVNSGTSVVTGNDEKAKTATTNGSEKIVQTAAAGRATGSGRQSTRATAQTAPSASDNEGFVALMLCDPLICSGDEQVIRMELPGNGAADGNSSQPVIADVVVGEDGLVRAVRIVN